MGVAGLLAQAGSSVKNSPLTASVGPVSAGPGYTKMKAEVQTHTFWDRQNIGLFAGVGAARMLDYASTRHMRGLGRDEVLLSNWVVDDRPLFTGIELGGTAASIGVSYLFHRTHHHSLERWVSMVHIGVAVTGSLHNYALQPLHPAAAPLP